VFKTNVLPQLVLFKVLFNFFTELKRLRAVKVQFHG